MKRKILPYNPRLKAFARQLRRNMTLAEVLLWKDIKQKKMCGYDFDRQHPIDEYIVDFYCKDLQLAVEIDGQSHDFKPDRDAERQKRLEHLGVHFLRFWDYEVKHDKTSVLRTIEKWIGEHEGTHPFRLRRNPLQGGEVHPPLSPPRRGSAPTPIPSKEGIKQDSLVTKSTHAVYRIVDGEAVIVEPRNGMVNVINTVGSRIWELIDGKRTVAQIADIISSEYEISPQTALQDTSEFLNEMAANGLVKLAN